MSSGQPVPGSRTIRSYTPREIFHSKELGNPGYDSGRLDATYSADGANTGYTDELREGTPLGRITASKLLVPCRRTKATAQGVAATSFPATASQHFMAGDTVSIVDKNDVLKLVDDDNAATTGVAIYVHVDELDGQLAHFESVTAGNADFNLDLVGGSRIRVEDDDAAATGGVALYFDEDAANPDERFLANLSTGKDAFVKTSSGRLIRIKYNATPATPGVQVYGDDDASSALNRFLYVSPTNASSVIRTDDEVGLVERTAYVTLGSGITVSSINQSTKAITLDTASTWDIGSHLIGSGEALAGSETCIGILESMVQLYDHKTRANVDKSVKYISSNAKLLYDNMLGDIAAILDDPAHKVTRIQFYDDGVVVNR